MAKMLGCLVASMTLGAVLLDWFQPNRPDAETPRRQLIAQIRNAIDPTAKGGTTTEKWQTIRALPLSPGEPARVHFTVDAEGRWTPTSLWKNQQPIGEPGVIRIGLQTSSGSGEITSAQWSATCQLRNNLQEMYKITRERFIPSPDLRLPNEPRDRLASR